MKTKYLDSLSDRKYQQFNALLKYPPLLMPGSTPDLELGGRYTPILPFDDYYQYRLEPPFWATPGNTPPLTITINKRIIKNKL